MTYEAIKDPAEKLDYTIDYSFLLAESDPDDQISTSVWTLTTPGSNLVIDASSIIDASKAVVWISGGSPLNSSHRLTNHIVCISTREYERTIKVTIRNK
jgi:hypothetical protein